LHHHSPNGFHEKRFLTALNQVKVLASPLTESFLEDTSKTSRFETPAERKLVVLPVMHILRRSLIRLEKLFDECLRSLGHISRQDMSQIWDRDAKNSTGLQYAMNLAQAMLCIARMQMLEHMRRVHAVECCIGKREFSHYIQVPEPREGSRAMLPVATLRKEPRSPKQINQPRNLRNKNVWCDVRINPPFQTLIKRS
jgi:hypothetical protein